MLRFNYQQTLAVKRLLKQTMPCLLVIISLFVPRMLLFFIFVLTNWFGRSFDSVVWPIVGFFIMPYTTLAYMARLFALAKKIVFVGLNI